MEDTWTQPWRVRVCVPVCACVCLCGCVCVWVGVCVTPPQACDSNNCLCSMYSYSVTTESGLNIPVHVHTCTCLQNIMRFRTRGHFWWPSIFISVWQLHVSTLVQGFAPLLTLNTPSCSTSANHVTTSPLWKPQDKITWMIFLDVFTVWTCVSFRWSGPLLI